MYLKLPDVQTLSIALTSIFRSNGHSGDQVTVIDRKPNVFASTFPSEIVTCKFGNGKGLRLFCKYENSWNHEAFGHRGDIAYEVEVYRQILRLSDASTPVFYGAYKDMNTGKTWLVLEYLDKSVYVSQSSDTDAMKHAARWIGEFHRRNEETQSRVVMSSLKTYDRAYYLGWSRRTLQFAQHLHSRFTWLPILCERFEECVGILLSAPRTVIHGEYFPKNILYRNRVIFPIDWQSGAIASGEIDLASLTEGWPLEIVHECEHEYEQWRWPNRSPSDFRKVLDVARLYWLFRWLGDRPEWTAGLIHFFKRLELMGERLGLL